MTSRLYEIKMRGGLTWQLLGGRTILGELGSMSFSFFKPEKEFTSVGSEKEIHSCY